MDQQTREPVRLPAGVATTAVTMASERRIESARADRLFDDPWAGHMVDAGLAAAPESADWLQRTATLGDIEPDMAGYVPLRVRWIDDRALAHARESGGGQVVLLGAGLDTRAARLPWPDGTRVFAVDLPEVVELASRTLADVVPGGVPGLVPVPSDLAGDWAADLQRSGFTPGAATTWIVEGVLMYLSAPEADGLVRRMRDLSGPGSAIVADAATPRVVGGALVADGQQMLQDNGSPFRSAIEAPELWFAERGWDGAATDTVGLADGLGRPVPPPLDDRPTGVPGFWFLEATTGRGSS